MNNKYLKVSRSTVKRRIKTDGSFKGFAVGNKVNPANFFEGWHLACDVTFNSLEEFEKKDNELIYYLDKELGSRIIYYEYI